MATYREISYMILDELKLYSDDSSFTMEHILFLIDKYRAFLLEKKYRDIRKSEVSRTNYQEICLDLIEVPAIPGTSCSGVYLKSTKKVPSIMNIGIKHIYPVDYFTSEHITYIPLERMPYVGYNRWLSNIIYVTKGPDDYLYLNSTNFQFLHLRKIRIDAIFQSPSIIDNDILCNKENVICDILDAEFPLEETLIVPVIQMAVQELSGLKYLPSDNINNAKDDMDGKLNTTPKQNKNK